MQYTVQKKCEQREKYPFLSDITFYWIETNNKEINKQVTFQTFLSAIKINKQSMESG